MKNRNLKMLIQSDLMRYGYKNKKPSFFVCFALHGYNYSKVMRKTRFYKENNVFFLYVINRISLYILSFIYGFQIPYNTDIGEGLYIGHFGRIIVNCNAELGKNINLSPGVTIGMTNRGSKKGVPKIGNGVWIGTNSIIVGNVNIGNDVMIAPNSFVNFDVPSHSIVVGNPGVIHSKENATQYYVENKV